MEFPSEVYKRYLASNGLKGKLWYFARKILVYLYDPVCTLPIHGRMLKLPLSHQLPAILKYCPHYDRLPARISAYLRKNNRRITCVDVGANIGDTIASFYTDEEDVFLAIEPYSKFNKILALNWGWNKNVTVLSDFCSSESTVCAFSIQEKNGSALILKAEKGIRIPGRTLDEIVAGYSFAPDINVIKIDTDGHDLDVIAGGKKLISKNMPIILFEGEPADAVYIENCLRTLNNLSDIGYEYFLLYDSRGNFLGLNLLSDLSALREQFFHQMEHDSHCFEILIMKTEDILQFHTSECDYFQSSLQQNESVPASSPDPETLFH